MPCTSVIRVLPSPVVSGRSMSSHYLLITGRSVAVGSIRFEKNSIFIVGVKRTPSAIYLPVICNNQRPDCQKNPEMSRWYRRTVPLADGQDWVGYVKGQMPSRLYHSQIAYVIDHGIAGVQCGREMGAAGLQGERSRFRQHESAEEWLGGPMTALRNLRMLREALLEIRDLGTPRLLEDSVSTREDGRTVVRVFPRDTFDKALYAGFVADVWMQDGVTPDNVVDTMAVTYQSDHTEPNVTLVLGAGNVASIGPMDVMHQLFVDNSVCLLKLNPVNAYLGPVFEEAFAVWIESGFLEVCYGGAEVGEYLCQHAEVDRIHITGSDRTHDMIVWGPSSEQEERKARGEKVNEKPITSELVMSRWSSSPVIGVRPTYGSKLKMWPPLVNNGSFNCNAAKLLIMQTEWKQRDEFLHVLRDVLRSIPPRRAHSALLSATSG